MRVKVKGLLVLQLVLLLCAQYNNCPIVAVLAQELEPRLARTFPQYYSYIAASYVKAIEASGARVVPLNIGQSADYYTSVMKSVSGLLLPGGNSNVTAPEGYAGAAKTLIAIAEEMNASGDRLPVLGVCQGLQMLAVASNGGRDLLTPCLCNNVNLALDFKPDFLRHSQLFASAPKDIINIFSTHAVTSNHHLLCLTEANLTAAGLDQLWVTVATDTARDGVPFVAVLEHRHLPFVGVQFHPEKSAYEWRPRQNNPHTFEAILAARYIYDWLVTELAATNIPSLRNGRDFSPDLQLHA